MNSKPTMKRHWLATLLAAVCIPLGTQTAWAQDDPVTYQVTRTARTNNVFTFTQPSNNVEVTVSYVDAGVVITNGETTLYYATLADVFANVDNYAAGDVITLQTNETLTTGITISKAITLDLNGKTLTYEGTGTAVSINSNGALTICDNSEDGNGGIISAVANSSTINNAGTLTISGGNISSSGENSHAILNTGTLTVSGGNISSTNGYAIAHDGTTFNLSGAPSLSGTTADIYLNTDKIITINAALTAPVSGDDPDPWTVSLSTNTPPYVFTSDWPSTMSTADPALFFRSTTAGVTTRFVDGTNEGLKKAQFVTYVALDAEVVATVPVITNNGQTGVGSRTASLAEGNVWVGDELSVSTTATPGITWQWYRVSGTTETAIEGATAATYTLTADDVGYTIIAKATQPANIAGIGHPASNTVVASAATVAVVKKDNFGELAATDDDFTTYDTDKSDYVKIELTTARTDIEYMVVASDATGVTENSLYWTKATCPEADGPFALSQYVTVSGETAILSNMLPGTTYKLYYRQKETDDTKHGTTGTTYDKPANEAVITFTTRTFDYLVTTQGVTYKISEDPTATVTATVTAISGEGISDHKSATVLASISADNAALVARIDVWAALGYSVNDEISPTAFTAAIAVTYDIFDEDMDLSTFGSSIDHYGILTTSDEDGYATFMGQAQTTCTAEGYLIYLLNGGYYCMCNEDGIFAKATPTKSVTESGMTAILTVEGTTGGGVVFKDKAGDLLTVAEAGSNAGKSVAAPGQTVVVNVTLPTGFEFVSDACKILNVTYGTTTETTTLADTDVDGTWTAEFTMPSKGVTVSFKEAAPIQGRAITVTIPTSATLTGGTMEAAVGNPTTVRILDELTFTLTPTTPTNAGDSGYELTDLGLTPATGVTATIKDATTNADVTLPYEGAVKVTLKIAADIEGDELSFTPVFNKTYERIAFGEGKTTYCYGEGMMLRTANENLKFYTVTSVSGTTVTVTEITSKTIPALMPIIVENNTGAAGNFDMYVAETDAANTAYATACGVTAATQFKGTAEATTLTFAENTDYYGFNGSDFVWIKKDATASNPVAAHRCWLEISTAPAGARPLTLVWPDGTTKVVNVNGNENGNGEWHDLGGRKFTKKPTRKGVYIVGQRTVVVK